MKPEKVWAALELYDRDLQKHGFGVQQFSQAQYDHKDPLNPLPRAAVLRHCRWMIHHCLTVFRPEFEAAWSPSNLDESGLTGSELVDAAAEARSPLEKAMRWLCYVQGAVHAHGLYSCNELRDHSRGGEGVFKTPAQEHGGAVPPVPDLTDEQLDRARMDRPPAAE